VGVDLSFSTPYEILAGGGGRNASGKYSNDLLLDQRLAQRRRRRTGDQTTQRTTSQGDEAYEQLFAEVVEKEPEELGYNFGGYDWMSDQITWTMAEPRTALSSSTSWSIQPGE
jgi:hypothetical protein